MDAQTRRIVSSKPSVMVLKNLSNCIMKSIAEESCLKQAIEGLFKLHDVMRRTSVGSAKAEPREIIPTTHEPTSIELNTEQRDRCRLREEWNEEKKGHDQGLQGVDWSPTNMICVERHHQTITELVEMSLWVPKINASASCWGGDPKNANVLRLKLLRKNLCRRSASSIIV